MRFRLIKVQYLSILVLVVSSGNVHSNEKGLASESMNPLSTIISLPFELNTFYNIGPEETRGSNLNIKPIYPIKLNEWNLSLGMKDYSSLKIPANFKTKKEEGEDEAQN